MPQEVEVKILEVHPPVIVEKMAKLGAKKVQDTRLTVDWFRLPDREPNEVPWHVRVRTNAAGETEITWKNKPKTEGGARVHEEINFAAHDANKARDFFAALGLIPAGHQEKDRVSWTHDEWRFDLDTYPRMPSWLEIEGRDPLHVDQAIILLDLRYHRKVAEGERVVITERYGLDWYDLRFEEAVSDKR